MTKILHLSDMHFGTETPAVVAALEQHVQCQGVDLLILSGDITQRARRTQFASAQAFIQRLYQLGVPVHLSVPGNHDIPLFNLFQRFFKPYANYRRYLGHELEPYFENDQLVVIGLNTTHPRRHKDGLITPKQIQHVCERLSHTASDKVRIVVAHQPFGAMVSSDLKNLQRGAQAALQAWAHAGLDVVMGGHIHLPYIRPLRQQYPELAREIWTVQAGTATSSRIRHSIPNSFNRLHIHSSLEGKRVQVERWDFQQDQFVLGTCLDLDLGSAHH